MPWDGYVSQGFVSDMNIPVTHNEFHDTHRDAGEAKRRFEREKEHLTSDDLREIHRKLLAGQRLTDAETGPDCMFATSYHNDIRAVSEALKARG